MIKSGEKDVTANYVPEYVAGSLKIVASEITKYVTLDTADVAKVYDGTKLTAGTATATDANGNAVKVEYSVDGKNWTTDPSTIGATEVKESKTVQVRASVEGTYTGYVEGTETITIKARPVTLTSATLKKTYDGTALVNADAPKLGITLNENKLLVEEGWVDGEGAIYTFDGTQTLVGSSANKFSYKLKENTKAENYTITKTEGTLTVTDDDVDTDKVITKTHEGNEFALGETITFTIRVKNIYDDVKTITITEQEGVTITGESVFENVKPGAEVTTTAKYVVREQDILEQNFHNTATASFTNGKAFDGEDDATVEEAKSAFKATKVITEEQQNATFGVGDIVSFKIIVENTGNVTLNNVTVGEDLEGAIIEDGTGYTVANNVATIETLAPKAIMTVYAKYTVQQTDVDDADLVNTATVNAKDPEGKDLEEEKPSVEVPTDEQAPGMVAEKEIANPEAATGKDGKFKVGDTVEFNITVTNTGNVTLKNITVEEMDGVVIDDGDGYTVDGNVATIASLSPENPSVVVKAHYVVTQEDVERGDLVNVATVKEPGTDVPKKPIVPVPTEDPIPAVAITKTTTSKSADAAGYALDETITYAIKATNTGNMILDNVVITDAKTGDTWNVGTLMPGATTKEFSASYKVTQSDILTGSVENTAIVVGTPHRASKEELPPVEIQAAEEAVPGNDTVTDSATVTDPTVKPSSAIQVTKTVTSQGSTITVDGKETTGYRVGDTIEFNIHVENIGNITVNNIVVNDVPTLSAGSPNGQITIQAGDGYTVNESTATIATLAPKASVDIKASYLVIAGDGTLNGNELSNAAFATGTSEDPNNPQPGDSSKTNPVPIEPEPDGHAEMQGSITVTKMITTSANKTPENGVDAVIKVGLYDNASFSGTPIAVNTITISKATSGSTVFDELDNTSNTTYYVAELDANNNPIIGASAHLDGYGVPSYSENCKNGINPTTATDTSATIVNPLAANDDQDETEETEETEVTTETEKETSSTTKPSGGSNTSGSAKSSTAAKTGDDTNMMVYWMLLGMAALAGCTAVVYRKKKRNQ